MYLYTIVYSKYEQCTKCIQGVTVTILQTYRDDQGENQIC